MTKLNTKTSVVDYLKSKGRDSSFSNRAKLASQAGIKNYRGTTSQNTALLKALQSQKPTSPSRPQNVLTKPVVTKPTFTDPKNTITKPVVTKPTPPNTTVSPPIALPPVPRPAPFPSQSKDNTKLPTPAPNPLEDKVKSLESELSNLRNALSSKSELEQGLMQPQPMFDIGQLASLLQPPQPQFNMSEITGQFNNMFSQLQNEYNSRLEAMQRMLEQQNAELQNRYDELLNKFKYNQAQLNPVVYGGVGNGISLFENENKSNGTSTNTSGTPVGYRQSVQMNDALFRYMQNLWGGGF